MVHFQDRKYDDYKVVLWDYNNQRELGWGVSHALSHPDKELTFPVDAEPVDGITITERLRDLVEKYEENKN